MFLPVKITKSTTKSTKKATNTANVPSAKGTRPPSFMTKYVVIKMSMENILIADAPLTELTNRMGDWDAARATQSLPRIVAPPTRVTANGHHPGSTSSMKRKPAAQAAKPRSTHAVKNNGVFIGALSQSGTTQLPDPAAHQTRCQGAGPTPTIHPSEVPQRRPRQSRRPAGCPCPQISRWTEKPLSVWRMGHRLRGLSWSSREGG